MSLNKAFLTLSCLSLLSSVVVVYGSSPNCKPYTVKAGDFSYQVVLQQCGCDVEGKICKGENYVKGTDGTECPSALIEGTQVEICCARFAIFSQIHALKAAYGSPKCTGSPRTATPGEKVFITIDDGPSTARPLMLDALKALQAQITFFEWAGLNICKDGGAGDCVVSDNTCAIQSLARTASDGHLVGSHSDNHYWDTVKNRCDYVTVPPTPRAPNSAEKCGLLPVQNMVEGARLFEVALRGAFFQPDKEADRQRAIDEIWTYARLPCGTTYRAHNAKTPVNKWYTTEEKTTRETVADTMYSGNVTCRPDRYQGEPWQVFGFDYQLNWGHSTILNEGEVCRLIELVDAKMEDPVVPLPKGKVVILSHDKYFNSVDHVMVMANLILELRAKGYEVPTLREF